LEKILDGIKLFIFDVDGTLILGSEPLPFAKEILILLKELEKDFLILSNNSSYSVNENKRRLEEAIGVELSTDNLYTSIQATIDFLLKNDMSKCFIAGTPSMILEFENSGIKNVNDNPQAIVLGFDKTLTYEKIKKISLLLQKEEKIPFYATHPDSTCPMDYGKIPDVGSFLKMFEEATGRTADLIFGKPNGLMLELCLSKKDVSFSEVLVIGDRLETDFRMAEVTGALSALVLTGETTEEELSKLKYNPNFIWESLEEFHTYLKRNK
jgi:NagD protein